MKKKKKLYRGTLKNLLKAFNIFEPLQHHKYRKKFCFTITVIKKKKQIRLSTNIRQNKIKTVACYFFLQLLKLLGKYP